MRFSFADHVPDSSQEHATNSDDGFPVIQVSLDVAAVDTESEFRTILRLNDSVGDFDRSRFHVRACRVDASRPGGSIALGISRA